MSAQTKTPHNACASNPLPYLLAAAEALTPMVAAAALELEVELVALDPLGCVRVLVCAAAAATVLFPFNAM